MIAQLIVVFQNSLKNSGPTATRNLYQVHDVTEESKLKESIAAAVKLTINGGHVLVKYKDKLFVAEKDTNNPVIDYVFHPVVYHPHQDKFTV